MTQNPREGPYRCSNFLMRVNCRVITRSLSLFLSFFSFFFFSFFSSILFFFFFFFSHSPVLFNLEVGGWVGEMDGNKKQESFPKVYSCTGIVLNIHSRVKIPEQVARRKSRYKGC